MSFFSICFCFFKGQAIHNKDDLEDLEEAATKLEASAAINKNTSKKVKRKTYRDYCKTKVITGVGILVSAIFFLNFI